MVLFLRLILAHLIADFVLQPGSWVSDKNQRGIKSVKLFYHICIVTVLSIIFTLDYFSWKIPVFLFLFHYLIDLGKIYLKPKNVNHLLWFLLDQLFHIVVIFIVTAMVGGTMADLTNHLKLLITNTNVLIYILSYFIVIWPSMIIINLATKRWQKQISHDQEPNLKNAGMWIGILERILVLTFVLCAQFQAIGFLIAAKSILRISVKSEVNARVMSEYVLIGTLISFTIAIFAGILSSAFLL